MAVEFVAPGSPAQAAGFKPGETITLIDQKPIATWADTALAGLRFAAAGTTFAFTMKDGGLRSVKLVDFF